MRDDYQHWFTAQEIDWLFGLDAAALEVKELVFSVTGDLTVQALYPAYQFDPDLGQPWPVINTLRLQFEAASLLDWLSIWLEEPNSAFLGDPPASHLGDEPEKVVATASRFLIRHHQHHQTPPFGNQTAT
jgi:hypothetical protein